MSSQSDYFSKTGQNAEKFNFIIFSWFIKFNVHAQAVNEYCEGPNVDGSCGPQMEIMDCRQN